MNKLNGGSGFLYNRLRYLRRKDRDQCKKKPQTVNGPEELESTEENENQNVSDSNPSEFDSNDDHVTQQSYQMDDLLFLKTIVVNEDNLPEIRKMLRKTLSRRQELLNSEKVNLLEHFPFFFVHPQLVSSFYFMFVIFFKFKILLNDILHKILVQYVFGHSILFIFPFQIGFV